MSEPTPNLQVLPLEKINIYGGTQARMATDDEAIASYAEELKNGAVFPPVTVYFDGATYWLADGFHRYLSTKRAEFPTITAEVHAGGRGDALKHALGANGKNSLYRKNSDKRNSVEIALEEWGDRANSVIAELCQVSPSMVRRCREEMEKAQRIPERKEVIGKDGKPRAAKMERQPRGKTEKSSSEAGGGGASGGNGRGSASVSGGSLIGGSSEDLEVDARAMIRKGELNPFELTKIPSASVHDYAESVITLLSTIKIDAPDRTEGLLRIKRYVENALAVGDERVSSDRSS
ncbi:MAG TPA: ParB/Srx family N-terminal domain-containing protein [Opitutaceae bacterium]|nr:ParB/Srx family N-terminal domain-containing protein [Opitutaceae bacterium]